MSTPAKSHRADVGPVKITRPRTATDPDALLLDLADLMADAHTTADSRIVALGLDLAPVSGYAYALIKPGESFDPSDAFSAMGQLDLKGGDWDSGPATLVRLRQFLQVIKPAVIFCRELPDRPPSNSAVAITSGRKADDAIRDALKISLIGWASHCNVPCRSFAVGALKKRFLGRGVANKADLVAACNDLYGVALDSESCDVTGVDRVAVAALGLLAGLEDLRMGIVDECVDVSITAPRSPQR